MNGGGGAAAGSSNSLSFHGLFADSSEAERAHYTDGSKQKN